MSAQPMSLVPSGEEVADEMASAAGDDAAPGFGVLLEGFSLEGIDLIADKAGDGHGWSPVGGLGWGRAGEGERRGGGGDAPDGFAAGERHGKRIRIVVRR